MVTAENKQVELERYIEGAPRETDMAMKMRENRAESSQSPLKDLEWRKCWILIPRFQAGRFHFGTYWLGRVQLDPQHFTAEKDPTRRFYPSLLPSGTSCVNLLILEFDLLTKTEHSYGFSERIRMQGFLQSDYLHKFPQFLEHITENFKQGKIVR
ncbi:hypothetical protein F3Y22_tig00111398pilonHSYRG00487 [Hibiscus syriacus]|uniref:Uncharacterized protein n=1 Tax=Hibiscus syriacus TaxID=106335 RepID=A0A6A2YAU0_HIBSY|nr:hypothetical protein F3Y22_tig00111398pilonHSYRG00487 [Hibiscus syriacus]